MSATASRRTGDRVRREPPRPTRRAPGNTRPRRRVPRRYLVRRWAVLGSFTFVVGVVVVVFFTPLLGAHDVEVSGTEQLTADDVRAAAAVAPGTPLVRLDTDEVAARVAQLPRVDTVQVRRSYPGTVRIAISERTPVLAVQAGDGVHLVDGTGLDFSTVKAAPPGLPVLSAPDQPSRAAAAAAVSALPPALTALVASVAATTPVDIRLTLGDGRLVVWGGAEDSARKAAVLGPLLTRPGKTYDVAAADFPTVAE
ncbi:FtsQ-type POTRA domain-containing protein [Actinokineospora sp. PR83]|uniref:cell division protein FtsQ/DivIB n=1 Tax=Actinokineospora sp. PR83 TaxID=2884908 RepID=UPI001F180A67|nr:FtsQ-type POTRA domain-containing protein [Actinokineospora sp. PR83]MCG8914616.1 FtsQ-type POTRA domain-containing protein [Actinokineospora sp. PR83]